MTPRAAMLAARVLDAALFAVVMAQGPTRLRDTASYLANAVTRPPLYPLLLDFAGLFGPAALHVTIAIQVLLGLVAAHLLGRELARALHLGPTAGRLLLPLLLALPQVAIAPLLTTESVALSLFLLLMRELIRFLGRPSVPDAVRMAAWLAALLLTRAQFLFVCPLLLGVALLLAVGRTLRPAAGLVAVVIAGVLGSAGLHAVYGAVLHGDPRRVPVSGAPLLTVMVYAIDPGDEAAVTDPADARYLGGILRRVRDRELLPTDEHVRRGHFRAVYNDIVSGSVIAEFRSGLDHKGMTAADWRALEEQTMRVALTLLRAEPLDYLRHVAFELQKTAAWPLVLALLLGAIAVARYSLTPQPAWLVLAVAAGGMWVNALVVAAVLPLLLRYTLYTDTLFLAVLVGWMLRPQVGEAA